MALRIVATMEEALASPSVVSALRGGVAQVGQATLMVPSFSQALFAQRALAQAGGLGLGVSCCTPSSWVAERWEVWGDGRHIVDGVARRVLVRRVLERESPLAPTPGAVATLCEMVQIGLPWLLEEDACSAARKVLTQAERDLLSSARGYAHELRQCNLVEESEACCEIVGRLTRAGVPLAPVVLAGFDALPRAMRELVCELAFHAMVTLVVPASDHQAHKAVRRLQGELIALAELRGLDDVEYVEQLFAAPQGGDDPSSVRDAELDELRRCLFDSPGEALSPSGSVGALLAAGPLAEAELVCGEVERLVRGGSSDIVVCAPDVRRAWRELAPKLVARGVAVQAQTSVSFGETEAGRAFLQFVRGVSRMAELDGEWPQAEPVGKDLQVSLGDMSWWPPSDLVDFLLSDCTNVSPASAYRIDALWRANRLLTPGAVLDTLQSERDVTSSVAQATKELLRGHIGSAASKLLQPLMARSEQEIARETSRVEAVAALGEVLTVGKALGDLGLSADPASGTLGLSELVAMACDVLEHASVMIRLRARAEGGEGAAPVVRLMGEGSASLLPPCSTDALIVCGLTSHESPIPRDPHVSAELLAELGIEPTADPMVAERARFYALLGVPRRRLVFERSLTSADGKPAYSSVMLIEALACYGVDAGDKPERVRAALIACLGPEGVAERAEVEVGQNASAAGAAPAQDGCETPLPAGKIESRLGGFVLPPPEGVAVEDDAGVVLSASQIETYLECPYKWFSLRRLRLSDADAPFSGAEMGTFAHRVLEVTHQQMLEEAATEQASALLAEAAARGIEVPLKPPVPLAVGPDGLPADDSAPAPEPDLVALAQELSDVRLARSRVSMEEGSLAHAQQLLEAEFDLHLSHQYLLQRGRRPPFQALVAHNTQERGLLAGLRKDLLSTLEYEGQILAGFEPRLFEWSFGRSDQVSYAGVQLVGTVDRVDVDAHRRAVVIDYKHKRPAGFASEYDVLTGGARTPGAPFALPRRVQSLIYGQVVRRRYPDLKVVGATYLCTRGDHVLSGAVDENAVDAVFGMRGISKQRLPKVAVSRADDFGLGEDADARGMDALLDATEEAIAQRVRELLAGDIEARPLDKASCAYCPVLNCERRIRS